MKTEKDEAMRRELVSKGAVLDMLEEMGRREQRIYTGSRAPEAFGALGTIFRAAGQVEAMKAEPAARWVPLTEALPEDGTWNLFTDGRRISLERYKQDAEDHFYPAGRYFDLAEAVAWMELPKQAWTLPVPMETEAEE